MRRITGAAVALDAAKRSGVDAAVWQAERDLQEAVRAACRSRCRQTPTQPLGGQFISATV